jgi:hypothetical protein
VQTYFLALFATAAVLLGLAIAFLIGFVQMAGGRFTPAVAAAALRDRWILWCLIVLSATLIGLGAACLVLALPPPRPTVPFLTHDQGRVAVGTVGLLIIGGDVALIAFLVLRVAEYVNAPSLSRVLVDRLKLHTLIDESEKDLTGDEQHLAFLPLLELLNYAVRNGDRATAARMMAAITDKLGAWLREARTPARQRIFLDRFREGFLESVPELIARHGVPSLHGVYLPALGRMSSDAWTIDRSLLDSLLEHLCKATVTLILSGEDSAAAKGIRALFNIEEHVASDSRSRDRVHQALGSVGRAIGRLLPANRGYRHDAPGFGYLDESQSEVMDELEEGYWRLCDARAEAGDSEDSCIWVEAVEVTIIALLNRGMETDNFGAIRNHVTSLLSDLALAVPKLTYTGCERALILWEFALERIAGLHFDSTQDELWNTIAEEIARLGAIAVDLDLTAFGGWSVAEKAVDALGDVPRQYWPGAIQEMSFHGINERPSHDARWNFTTQAGVRHHTNFGLMFDENTGDLYADDDPRRR